MQTLRSSQPMHGVPPRPHESNVRVVTQVVPLQQPGHNDCVSQTHAPRSQRCPTPQTTAALVQMPKLHESCVHESWSLQLGQTGTTQHAGTEETARASVAVTQKGYEPDTVGMPLSAPDGLRAKPGGNVPLDTVYK